MATEEFETQYKRELIYQEVKANKYTLKGFGWFLLGLAFVWLLTVTGFFEVDKKLISLAFVSVLVILLPLVYISLKGDLSWTWLKYYLLSLVCVASAVVVSFLSYHAALLYVVPILFAAQYRKRRIMWFTYGVNTFTMLISSIFSFYYGICDLNILLESQHVRSFYMDIITEEALNIPFNDNVLFIIIVFEVFPRSIILLIFSIILQYTLVSSNEDAFKIAHLTYLKETDVKTRVFNNNKYEEMVEEYYPGIEQISVIFMDLNNLKNINDKFGHAAGDKAIEQLSGIIDSYSDDRCRVYRVGGDEFLIIIDNPSEGEAEEMMKAVEIRLEENNKENEISISSAAGIATGSGKNILDVVKEADAKMYENKKLIKEKRNQ